MGKAKLYGMCRKVLAPRNNRREIRWNQERKCEYGNQGKQVQHPANGPGGAIQERVDYEVSRIVENILDVNTEACVERKLTLTIKLKPDENRQYIKIAASAVSKLAPATPVGTTLGIAADGNGEMVIVESVPQVPGQMSMEGTEQEPPKMLRIAAMK